MSPVNDQAIAAYIEGSIKSAFADFIFYSPGDIANPAINYTPAGSVLYPPNKFFVASFNETTNVDVFFDNMTAKPKDERNHMIVNVTFGESTENTLGGLAQRARGAVVVRIYTAKNSGAGVSRRLGSQLKDKFMEMSCTKKRPGLFLRLRSISGPESYPDVHQSYFMTKISAGWEAEHVG